MGFRVTLFFSIIANVNFLSAFLSSVKRKYSYYSATTLPSNMGAYSRGPIICKSRLLGGGLIGAGDLYTKKVCEHLSILCLCYKKP